MNRCLLGWLSAALLVCNAVGASPHLAVEPSVIELSGPRSRHRVLTTWVDAVGRCKDVSAKAALTTANPALAVVDSTGECRGVSDGETSLRVVYGSAETTIHVIVKNQTVDGPPSFANEIVPILTRFGCNQGSCHGKGEGQNGFRLSLRGYAPENDFLSLTREQQGRRLNRVFPSESLFLQKAIGAAPHVGGKLLNVGDRAERLLREWIARGAPGLDGKAPTVRRLEVHPAWRELSAQATQPLLVRAEYTDGGWRDVTWLTKFAVNDPGVAEVDAAGVVKALRPGETAIRAHFDSLVATAVLSIPHPREVDAALFVRRNNLIDDHVFRKLASLHIPPADLCDDDAFLRRVCLDTIGAAPTADEVRAFRADKGSDKRTRMIELLFARPEFVDFWAVQLGDLLQNRMERDHDVRGAKGVRAFHAWIRRQIAADRPWDEIARTVLTAAGSAAEHPEVGYYIVTVGENRSAERSEVVASVAQAFLGTRIGCAQCHNHPLERYTQDDFYHFAAYFTRLRFDRKEFDDGPTTLAVSTPEPRENKNPVGVSQPRTGAFLPPRPLDRSPTPVKPGEDPRVKLAAWITEPSNSYFSGAMVNRLWKHFFLVGLVEPVDDLRASNPPSNPELMQALQQEFVRHRYDLKHVMRLILNSRTYQLRSETTAENASDGRFYSHYFPRRLPAEVLLDALSQATGSPDHFAGYPHGVRAMQLPDPGASSYFLSLFGRSNRVTACACERSGEVTLPQLLHLQNGDSVQRKINDGKGRLALMLNAKPETAKLVDELFLLTFCRPPTAAEIAAVHQLIAKGEPRDEVFRDLFWALLNSKEFTFNR